MALIFPLETAQTPTELTLVSKFEPGNDNSDRKREQI